MWLSATDALALRIVAERYQSNIMYKNLKFSFISSSRNDY
jgi:hypothetical protein